MRTSVVICTFNGEDHIEYQLKSIINQIHKPDEIIICDDGSTDNTVNICKIILKQSKLSFLIEVNKTRLGIRDNFNKGIAISSGEIVFLSDQDDYWLDHKIQTHIYLYNSNKNLGMIINDCIFTDENLITNGKTKINKLRRYYNLKKSFIQGSCASFKTNFKELLLPIPKTELFHDKWISDLFFYLNKKYIVKEPLQLYRMHNSNNSGFELNKKSIGISDFKKKLNQNNLREELSQEIERIEILLKRIINSKISIPEAEEKLKIVKKSYTDRLHMLESKSWREKIKRLCNMNISIYFRLNNGYYSLIKDLLR